MNAKKKLTKTVPAYRDQLLKNRPSEQWDDIPGLDGYYEVSSFGRIKRNEREVLYPNGKIVTFPKKILMPRVRKFFNKHTRDYIYELHAHICLFGRRYHFPIRRLVYYCFVKPFPLNDPAKLIVSSKGNGLDISPANVEMMTRSQRALRIYSRKRNVSIFRQEYYRWKGTIASLAVNGRQVSQYNKTGKKVKTFPSISDAARSIGTKPSRISAVVNEREPTACGFFWKFGSDKSFDTETFLALRRGAYSEKRSTPVTQYDAKGKPVGHYSSLKDAGKAMGRSWTGISSVIRGISKTAFGYRWKKGHHNRRIKSLSLK